MSKEVLEIAAIANVESYPMWVQDVVHGCDGARQRVVRHELYRQIKDNTVSEARHGRSGEPRSGKSNGRGMERHRWILVDHLCEAVCNRLRLFPRASSFTESPPAPRWPAVHDSKRHDV